MPRLLRFLAAALLLAPTALPQTTEQELEAVQTFRKYFKTFKELPQRVEAIHTLKGQDCPEAAAELVELLDDRQPEIRDTAREVLTTYREDATFQTMIAFVADPKQKNQDRRAKLIDVLGGAKVVAARPALVQIALEEKRASPAVRYAIGRALGAIGGAEAQPALANLLADADPLVRLAAVDSTGALRLQELAGAVLPLLDDREWQVQIAAVQTAAKLRIAAAIEPLIALMRKGGRLEEETAEALFKITALDFGTDPDEWALQWEKLKSIQWRIPTDEELAKKAESRKRTDAFYGKKEETTAFAGIPTTSTKVLFIIDVSGSMEDLVLDTERWSGRYENMQKLTIVKGELLSTLEGLAPNTDFNVVSFASEVKPFKKFLVPANIVNKAAAMAWVRNLKPIGGSEAQALAGAGLSGSANLEAGKTNTFAALMYAFGIDPENPPAQGPQTGKASIKNRIDTVFFLSDGRPSTGKLVDTEEIRKAVTELNRDYKMVLHAIAIGEFHKSFLKSLAEENGGVFVDLGR
jgi:HEAT repeat protein